MTIILLLYICRPHSQEEKRRKKLEHRRSKEGLLRVRTLIIISSVQIILFYIMFKVTRKKKICCLLLLPAAGISLPVFGHSMSPISNLPTYYLELAAAGQLPARRSKKGKDTTGGRSNGKYCCHVFRSTSSVSGCTRASTQLIIMSFGVVVVCGPCVPYGVYYTYE